jgi:nucleoside-diphosphate-sugar epimerase
MAQRLFLTGASGYVGRHVARIFVEQGYEVFGLVRSNAAAATARSVGAVPVRGELGKPDCYVHHAAAADVVIQAGFEYDDAGGEVAETDLTATRALLSAAQAGGRPSRFIYTASLFRYRSNGGTTFDEHSGVPRSLKDWRCALEREVLEQRTERHTTAAVRLGWVYGGDGGTLAQAIGALHECCPASIANNRLPLMHVDVAGLYLRIVEDGLAGPIHACVGQPLTVREIAASAPPNLKSRQGNPSHGNLADIFKTDLPATSLYDKSRHIAHNAEKLKKHLMGEKQQR